MKRLATIVLLLCTLTASAQWFSKGIVARSSLMLVSGFADGTAEVLRTDYSRFPASVDNKYWNPDISYKNKWKNGDSRQGERFPLSSTALVWTTDGYHLMRFVRNGTMIASVCIRIGERKTWKQYATDVLISYCAYGIGFNLAYEVIYK